MLDIARQKNFECDKKRQRLNKNVKLPVFDQQQNVDLEMIYQVKNHSWVKDKKRLLEYEISYTRES